MNISTIHPSDKVVSAISIFKEPHSQLVNIRLMADGELKEHVSKVPALLFCHSGSVVFEDEKGAHIALNAGDYTPIEPLVKHKLKALTDCLLLLFK